MENEATVPSNEKPAQADSTAAARSAMVAAEAAAIEATARARTARARAKWLHRRADIGSATRLGRHRLPRRRRRPRWRQLAVGASVALVCTSSAASGSMWWQHRVAAGQRQLAAEFAAAARRTSVALLTLDYTKIDEHVQRILDNSTGDFKASFQKNSGSVGERLRQARVVTSVDVKDAAVRSMSDNAGVVLVAVQTETTELDGEPHMESWRIAVSLARDSGQLKVSDIEFVE